MEEQHMLIWSWGEAPGTLLIISMEEIASASPLPWGPYYKCGLARAQPDFLDQNLRALEREFLKSTPHPSEISLGVK